MPLPRALFAAALTLASCTTAPEPTNYLEQGKTHGYTAAVAAQTAVTPGDWEKVADQWQRAMDQLDQVPREDPTYREAQAKHDEYFNNKLAALKNKSQGQITAIDRFNQWAKEADPSGAIVANAALDPEDAAILVVTVTPAFLSQNEAVKLEATRGIQQQWAKLSNPANPDRAHVWLKTATGTKIGGSRPMAATSVYVD